MDRRSSGPIWLIWFCGFFLVVGCGPIWPWFVGFFSFFLTVVGGDLVRLLVAVMVGGCGGWGMGGWMQWPAMLRIIRLRNRETKERERERKIKKN